LFLLLVSSSLILSFRYPLFFFLNVLLVSRLKFCRIFLLIWLGFCNHCNLAYCRWPVSFEYPLSGHGLLCFSLCILDFHLLRSLYCLLIIFKLLSNFSKATNLLEISTWYFSLPSSSLCFFRPDFSKSNFFLAHLLREILSLTFPQPGSGITAP
jgi:hypothetical protein